MFAHVSPRILMSLLTQENILWNKQEPHNFHSSIIIHPHGEDKKREQLQLDTDRIPMWRCTVELNHLLFHYCTKQTFLVPYVSLEWKIRYPYYT